MGVSPSPSMTNTQLEILKMFAYDLPEEELLELKQALIRFFAQRIRKRASDIWKERNYSPHTMKEWLDEETQ